MEFPHEDWYFTSLGKGDAAQLQLMEPECKPTLLLGVS